MSASPFSPHNAEAQVCAWALQRNDWADAVADDLSALHFDQRAFGDLWAAIVTLRKRGRAANPETLEPWLATREDWDMGELIKLVSRGAIGSRADFVGAADTIIEASEKRELILAAEDQLRLIRDEPGTSQLDLLAMMQARLNAVPLRGSSKVMTFEEVVMRRAETFNQPEAMGLPTGIPELDARFAGYAKEDLILFAGRASMGKSALLANSVRAMAQRGARGHFASAEMSSEQVADRSLSAVSWGDGRNHTAFQYRDMRSLDRSQRPREDLVKSLASAYAGYAVTFDFSPAQTVSHIRREARRAAQRFGGLDFIAVDHTHRLRPDGKFNSTVERFDSIAEGLKQLAREMRVPVIAAAQLNRQSEQRDNRRPQLSDLKNSGKFEEEADVVVLVHRESYYLSREEPQRAAFEESFAYKKAWDDWHVRMSEAEGKLELHTAKQRQGEPGIDVVQFAEGFDVIRSFKQENEGSAA